MNRSSFGDLPYEVQTMVISHVTQHDLASCIRVCKAWNKMTYPFLWRHIQDPQRTSHYGDDDDDDDEEDDGRYRPLPKEVIVYHPYGKGVIACARSGALKRNGHLVKSIRIESDMLHWSSFLQDCPPTFPRLTSLWIDGVEDHDEPDYSERLDYRDAGDDRDDCDGGDGKYLAQLLDRCSAGLRVFSFSPRLDSDRWSYTIGDKIVEALLKHAATLEVVRIGGDYACDWRHIDRLLCSLPKLKEIDFEFNCLTNRGGRLEVTAVADSDWVCLDLEVFGCAIKGIPRPEIPRTPIIDGKVRQGTREESLDLQRRVYTKLAKLTKLRELRLSSELDEWTDEYRKINKKHIWQYDCLSMTLESGLDVLKDLRDLRLVVLWYLENGISNAEETKWVQTNWPQVEIRFKKFYQRRR
ncbi:hypothetical protein EC957_002647 [Mortierella hygrophila]|uniref:F-box domain-containing protein n=1 Tax=Mortierella hygrophila TaxID=979708 RepID=A0A9P6F4J5_9FUNG|nr:hypothetical protein EC957_002647 [Mortierella hygrophila]